MSVNCVSMILPSTAEQTAGLCMPCKQKNDRLERQKYVEENKKRVDPFQGQSDRVEILKIMHLPRKHDALIEYVPYEKPRTEIYSELSEHEKQRLIQFVLVSLRTDAQEVALNVAREIASFTDIKMSRIVQSLIELNEFSTAYLFRGAGDNVASKLLSRLDGLTGDKDCLLELNNLLEALAWTGGEKAVAQFKQWRLSPPDWVSILYIPPEGYAHCAGWELDKNNKRRELVLSECYPLVERSSETESDLAFTFTQSEEVCNWCSRPVTNLIELDLRGSSLSFIPFSGHRLSISTCLVCAPHCDQLYMDVAPDGKSTWSAYNVKPNYLPDVNEQYDELPENTLAISTRSRLWHHSVDWCLPSTFSQVGGIPSWIQDTDYKPCPKCNETMVFVAQLSVEDVQQFGEGIYYGLLCPDCSITTVRYQQT